MKLIIAAIRPHKLEEVREALAATGVQGLMVSEVKGHGRQSGHAEVYQGAEYVVHFVPKIRLEAVVEDGICDDARAFVNVARDHRAGRGRAGPDLCLGRFELLFPADVLRHEGLDRVRQAGRADRAVASCSSLSC